MTNTTSSRGPRASAPFFRLLQVLALCLTASASMGCGVYANYPDDDQWARSGPIAVDDLPTAKVRASSAQAGMIGLLDPIRDQAAENDLFDTGPPLKDGSPVDFLLEFSLETEDQDSWFGVLGLIPGIPYVYEEEFRLTLRVSGPEGELGTVRRTTSATRAVGVLLLPASLLCSLVPGGGGNLDLRGPTTQ